MLILKVKQTQITMKKIFVIGCLFLLAACKSKQSTAETKVETLSIVKTETIPADLKTKAYALGKRVLLTCNTSRFKPFTTSEATASVIKNTTQERLSSVCHKFRVKYGNFKDIYLAEVLKNNKEGSYIFRYKAKYERDFANKELRVTMDKDQKVSAIKSTDWIEKIN